MVPVGEEEMRYMTNTVLSETPVAGNITYIVADWESFALAARCSKQSNGISRFETK
jgi:hypothetical protein